MTAAGSDVKLGGGGRAKRVLHIPVVPTDDPARHLWSCDLGLGHKLVVRAINNFFLFLCSFVLAASKEFLFSFDNGLQFPGISTPGGRGYKKIVGSLPLR
jgi:hypothetical protein